MFVLGGKRYTFLKRDVDQGKPKPWGMQAAKISRKNADILTARKKKVVKGVVVSADNRRTNEGLYSGNRGFHDAFPEEYVVEFGKRHELIDLEEKGIPIRREYLKDNKVCVLEIDRIFIYRIKDLLYYDDPKDWAFKYYRFAPIGETTVEENLDVISEFLPDRFAVAFANMLYEKRINQPGYRL